MDVSSSSALDQTAAASGTGVLWPTGQTVATDPIAAGSPSSDGWSIGDQWAVAGPSLAQTSGAAASDSLFGAVERGFTAVTGYLQCEFSLLERQFSGAFSSLIDGVSSTIASFGAPGRNRAPAHPPSPYDGLINRAAAKHQLDPALISAVMRQESGFRADVRSSAGALGLMQLMPETARQLGVADPMDPEQNVDGGARLLRSLLDRFGGRLDLALAAYNAGPSAVDRYGGVPPYPETQAYVRDIMSDYRYTSLSSAQ
jgi:hypothetical protein